MLFDERYLNAIIHPAADHVPLISDHVSGPFKLDPHHARAQQVVPASLAKKKKKSEPF